VLELRHALEGGEALLDLGEGQPGDSLGAELLDVEGGECRAVDDGRAQQLFAQLARRVRGEKADEAPGEGVAGAGRIENFLQRIGGQREESILAVDSGPTRG
jgi:hypothetical protein